MINESKLRKEIKSKNIEKEKIEYKKNLNNLNAKLAKDLNENELIKAIIEDNVHYKNELIDSFMEDYYIIFINNKLGNYIESLYKRNNNYSIDLTELKKVFEFFVKQNESINYNERDYETIASIINWFESYSIEITYFLKIYLMLKEYMEDINDKIKKIIEDNKIKYETSERCQEHTLKVNKALFYGFESILKIITSNKDLYIKLLKDNNISRFINNCKEIFNQVNKFNNILKLNSKEILSLQEIIALISLYIFSNILIISISNYDGPGIKKNIITSENLNTILNYYSEKTQNEPEIQNIFEQFFNDLKKIFENNKNQNYYKLISIVFKNEFMKYFDNNEFKKKVMEIIITDTDNGYISKLVLISDFSKSANVLLNIICLLLGYLRAYIKASVNGIKYESSM